MAQAGAVPCETYNHRHTIRGSNFTFSDNAGGLKGLVQSFNLQVQRQVNIIYDLASSDVYFVEAPPQGQLAIQRVLAPTQPNARQPLECRCDVTDFILGTGTDACAGGQPVNYRIGNAYQAAFQMQGEVTQRIIAFSATYVFTDISLA